MASAFGNEAASLTQTSLGAAHSRGPEGSVIVPGITAIPGAAITGLSAVRVDQVLAFKKRTLPVAVD